LHRLNLDTWTWECLDSKISGTPPSARSGHRLMTFGKYVYCYGGGKWTIAGGWVEQYNDIHILGLDYFFFRHFSTFFNIFSTFFNIFQQTKDTETLVWNKPQVKGVVPRTSTFCIPYRIGRQLFIFAGAEINSDSVHKATFCLDTVTMEWSEPEITNPKNFEIEKRDMGTGMLC